MKNPKKCVFGRENRLRSSRERASEKVMESVAHHSTATSRARPVLPPNGRGRAIPRGGGPPPCAPDADTLEKTETKTNVGEDTFEV